MSQVDFASLLDPARLRAFAGKPEVRAASYPLCGDRARCRIARGVLEITPDCVFYGRTRSLIGVVMMVLVPLLGAVLVGWKHAWLPMVVAVCFGIGLVMSEKAPLFSYGRVLACVRGGRLRYKGLEWRTEVFGGLVILESFEHPFFHSITHLVVDTAGQPLFCLAQHRRECGKNGLSETHLHLLDRALRVGVWRVKPGVDGDEITCCSGAFARPVSACPEFLPESEPSEVPARVMRSA